MMEQFSVRTGEGCNVIDITEQVVSKLKAANKKDASICIIFIPHTTAAITINEFEPNIVKDYSDYFKKLTPKADYRHNEVDDNAQAHLLSATIGASVVVPVHEGKLMLGTWQRILLVEGDGPRTRQVYVQIL